jgi:nucleoside-diphosphate-sugar epimerase
MRVFVAGGAGYVGSRLVPSLLEKGHEVVVYDLYLYDQTVFQPLQNCHGLIEIQGDIRDIQKVRNSLEGCEAIIHLACISNDPSFELNPLLGKSINLDSFEPFVLLSKELGVRRFIYASSSSVYGVKEELDVTEEMSLEPLTDYSLFKAECEKILLRHLGENFLCTILRPATVCGYAPRQRLDVVVNILTNLAYHTGKIKVMGGKQMRPNIHIEDMVRCYLHILEQPKEKIQGAIFNVGYHNHTVLELGEIVAKIVGQKRSVEIEMVETNDNRSYHVSSEKIARELQFFATHTIEEAVKDLVDALEGGKLPNAMEDKRYFNIKTMKAADLK